MTRSLCLLVLAVLLPWQLLFSLLQYWARREAERVEYGVGVAGSDSRALIARAALYRMIEEVDLPLVYSRGAAWFERWVRREGPAWPVSGPFVALTFHYGAGLWSLSDLGRDSRKVAFVHASLPPPPGVRPGFRDRLVAARLNAVARLGNGVTITVGGASRQAEDWLAEGGVILGLIDAPHYGKRRSIDVEIVGQSLAFPCGLIELAIRSSVPIYLYTMGLDGDGPKRLLSVAGPFRPDSAQDLAGALGSFFSEAVCRDKAAWEFLPVASEAFVSAEYCKAVVQVGKG